jgi:hypothetical protein
MTDCMCWRPFGGIGRSVCGMRLCTGAGAMGWGWDMAVDACGSIADEARYCWGGGCWYWVVGIIW